MIARASAILDTRLSRVDDLDDASPVARALGGTLQRRHVADEHLGQPGAHGAAVAGTHGMGVSTPIAAAVAAATIGLAMDWHMPKGVMFTIGLLSMMLAAGVVASTLLAGSTTNVEGATPKLH